MKMLKLIGIATCVAQLTLAQNGKLPFEMPKVNIPQFKTDTFNVVKYGAVGDGKTINTEAIANSIDACYSNGGGVVYFPSGLWETGPIVLKSNVNLCVSAGAMIHFSKNKDLYPLIDGYYEGVKAKRCQSPISGTKLTNVAITGKGVVDGAGEAWRAVKKGKLTENEWKKLVKSGGIVDDKGQTWYPSEVYKKGETAKGAVPENAKIEDYVAIKDYFRPVLVSLIACKNVLLDGVTFQNSPNWCLHPLLCEHLTVRNIRVYNPDYAQNGDAIDVESCRYGTITNSVFDAGDDAICIKSGKDAEGRKRGVPTEYFVITNNIVYHGHGGFVIGSEMSGGVRNLYVDNCTFIGTDIGLRFKSSRGRGGVVEKVWVSNINMTNIGAEAISFNMYYGGKSPIPDADDKGDNSTTETPVPAVDEGTPQFKDLFIKNIFCDGASRAILAQGLPEMSIQNIRFENINMIADEGIAVVDADHIELKNIDVTVKKGIPVFIDDSRNVKIDGINFNAGNTDKLVKVIGTKNKAISLKLNGAAASKEKVDLSPEVAADVVTFVK